MKIDSISKKEIIENDFIMKPSYHLNHGKLSVLKSKANGLKFSELGDVVGEVYTGGIFKRNFISNPALGIPYISAQHMMIHSPIDYSKIISKKFTIRQDDMMLKENQLLVSCAGTIGNVRLITKDLEGIIGSQDIIRVNPVKEKMLFGFLYAYLSTPVAHSYIQSFIYGSVVPRIEPKTLKKLPIPNLNSGLQLRVHQLIESVSELRVKANLILKKAEDLFYTSTGLRQLDLDDYDFFGQHSHGRKISSFSISSSKITPITFNAFNYSEKIKKIKLYLTKKCDYLSLQQCLNEQGFFSTGSFPRVEIDSTKSIRLINQSDIFNIRIDGKKISKKNVKVNNLVKYGEVLIAGVGTLGENETFCRTIFASEELQGQLISGEFIRMNTSKEIPSGYLFIYLSSEYGFRLIRSTQTGTKLCRPIQSLLSDIPIPIIDKKLMKKIHDLVCEAHTMRYQALQKEDEAILLIEKEIAAWQK
ncbi:MAG: restriction endonuclease subunit S [Ferruginibacter sp.]